MDYILVAAIIGWLFGFALGGFIVWFYFRWNYGAIIGYVESARRCGTLDEILYWRLRF